MKKYEQEKVKEKELKFEYAFRIITKFHIFILETTQNVRLTLVRPVLK